MQAVHGPVQPGHELGGRVVTVDGEGTQQSPELTHLCGGGDVVTGDVADDECRGAVG